MGVRGKPGDNEDREETNHSMLEANPFFLFLAVGGGGGKGKNEIIQIGNYC